MGKRLDSRDIGIECDYRTCSPTQEEAIRRVGEHIQTFRGMIVKGLRFFLQHANSLSTCVRNQFGSLNCARIVE